MRGPAPNNDPPDFGPQNSPICSGNSTTPAANTIGTGGGEVVFNNDNPKHVLTVLRNGVNQNVSFSMVEHRRNNFTLVRITPDGERFRRPAVLTMSYEGCALQSGNPLKIYRYEPETGGAGKWMELPSFHNPTDMTVSAAIGTLSDYAMGSD
jgi:hypothetical protein